MFVSLHPKISKSTVKLSLRIQRRRCALLSTSGQRRLVIDKYRNKSDYTIRETVTRTILVSHAKW